MSMSNSNSNKKPDLNVTACTRAIVLLLTSRYVVTFFYVMLRLVNGCHGTGKHGKTTILIAL